MEIRSWEEGVCDRYGASLFRPGPHAPQIPEGPIRCGQVRNNCILREKLLNPAATSLKQHEQATSDTMFGPFRATNPLSGGLLWKIPWRLSKFQKRRHRLRLRAVDSVVATLDAALAKKGQTLEAIERWKAEMPVEEEMLPRDKYTMFDRKEKKYRKGIHSMTVALSFSMLNFRGTIADAGGFARIAKVDESFAESQPSWILNAG